jgi:hypothetical protein
MSHDGGRVMEPTVGPGPRVMLHARGYVRAGQRRGARGRDPRPACVLAVSLVVAATGIGAVLVARGDLLPRAAPTVALVILLAITVNRGALFSTELMATAEAAVLFAAVVGFRRDAALLGPLIVALAVGPLDGVHWRQRAVVRMAYNSGSQGLAVVVGAVAFREISGAIGGSPAAVVAAGAVAAVPYALVDSSCGVALMLALGGSSLRDSIRHQWSLNALAPPLACVGALAGYLAVDVGWWLAVVMLLPVPWIPELVLVRVRRVRRAAPGTQVRLIAGSTIVAALAVAAVAAWSSGSRSSPALVVLAVALGAELRVSAARAVPPLAAMGVAAAAIVDGSGVLMAGLVGATITAASWVLARNARVVPASLAIVGAAIGGVVCGAAIVAAPTDDSLVVEVSTVALGAALFVLLAVLANGPRRDAWLSVAWTAPVLLVAVLLASTWNAAGAPGAFVFAAGVGATITGTAWAAAPAWDSRFLGRMVGARHRCRLRVVVVAVAAGSVAVACAATQVDSASARASCALVAAALVETSVAITLGVVRQWRFAPEPRARSAAALGVLAVLAVAVYVPLAHAGLGWSIPVLVALQVAVGAIAWPLARFTDSAGVTR